MTADNALPLDFTLLCRRCDPAQFAFATTAELEDVDAAIGQQRALESLHFGVGMRGAEYNIFALGRPGAGKLHTVRAVLAQRVAGQPPAGDWCYVNNFDQPHRPRALRLPPGRGAELQRDADLLVDELEAAIPATFESEDYRARTEELAQEFEDRRERALEELREEAEREDIVLIRTPGGFAFAPKGKRDDVLSPEEFGQLSEGKRAAIQDKVSVLQSRLQKILRQFPTWRKETREKIRALDREMAQLAVDNLTDALKHKYADLEEVLAFFDIVREHVIANVDAFRPQPESPMAAFGPAARSTDHQRYRVNLLVDNGGQSHAPVVCEDLPNHGNLIGRTEYQSFMGTLVTDFTMIKGGALHRANGGYLLLEARKVLMQPYAWETLKRTLEAGEIRIESLERTWGLMSTTTLEPEPIGLDVKVVLVGDRFTYYLLRQLDPDFPKLFKVAADFEDDIDRGDGADLPFARLLGSLARQHGLLPLDRTAVARVIDHGARLAEDSEKLSLHLGSLCDLLRESDYWAHRAGRGAVTAADVAQALDQQRYRSDRIRRRVMENIRSGTILIDTAGAVAGQVNGLSVVDLGDAAYGQPSRITATTRLGEGEFVDIERETELGGAIHSKGVLILSSFLAARYAAGVPLSVRVSLVFEQSYGGIEGDSASLAELCAILSSLSAVPIRQSLAVTGSVNQLGRVQPIGGVNEKIEGFFDVCREAGLDGSHGVLIPVQNVRHLMLRDEVVEAARQGQFSVYPVSTVDEALEILTGVPAGATTADGGFPGGSLNGRVERTLQQYAAVRRQFGKGDNGAAPESGSGG
jgi:lon-related putative ATP-dependent protease